MPRRAAKPRLEHATIVDADASAPATHTLAEAGDTSADDRPTAQRPRVAVRRPSGERPPEGRTSPSVPAVASRSQPGRTPRRRDAYSGTRESASGPTLTPTQGDEPSASRALVPAQRVTRKDSALVARQSQRLPGLSTNTRSTKAVTVVGPAGHETTVLPAPRRATPARALPVLAPPRRGRKRSLVGGALVAVATLSVVVGALYTVSPFSPIRNHNADFAPAAALLALSAADAPPGGPWDTSAGTTEALGLGGGAGPGVNAPGSAGLPVTEASGGGNFTASPGAVFVSAAPISPWPPSDPFMQVPDHAAYRVSRPSDGYYWWAFGQCTWWAQYMRRDENLTYLGDARVWASAAAARGYRVGHQAAPNATVVFYPGAQGAGGAGHVAHVEAVYPGGWFLVSEMNFYWNGGGWGRVDYRFVHEGWGVAFIY